MKLSVLHRTSENRGNHSADVAVAYELKRGETVEALAKRILMHAEGNERVCNMSDWVEIRIMKPKDD